MSERDQSEASPVRLVTFLGLGDERRWPERYQPLRYRLGARETEATPHHDVASLLHWGPRVRSVVVLGTPQVREAWFSPTGPGRYEQGLARHVQPLPPVLFQEIPSRPQSPQELWELFRRVAQALAPGAVSLSTAQGAPWSEPAPPGEIVFDITHGYRVAPFFAATAVAFVRAQQRRERAASPRLRILYTAQPEADSQVADVWEVSHFMDVLEWDAAIEDLMRHGRGDGLERLARDMQKQKHQAGQAPSQWTILGKASRDFADALATVRLGALLTESAGRLREAIQKTRAEVERDVPPLVPQLEALERWTSELQAERVVSRAGVRAALRLVERYLELERFAEATSVLRESLVTLAAVLRYGEGRQALEPAERGVLAQREALEHSLGEAEVRSRSSPSEGLASPQGWPLPLLRLWNAMGQLRNDVLHAGFNDSPAKAASLRSSLRARWQEATQVIDELLPEVRHEGGHI